MVGGRPGDGRGRLRGGRGLARLGWGATLVLLAPAACCLAGAVGLGVAAFEVDLAQSRFGWRQNLSAAAVVCLVVGLFPTLVSSVDGRSALASVGFEQILDWTTPGSSGRGYEVLWVGDPASVPAPSWQVRRGLALAVSFDGPPGGERLWPSANPGVGAKVETDITQAEAGLTVRLGSELALAGIRYLILPDSAAPSLPGVQTPASVQPPASLIQALQAQSDLRQLPTEGGVVAFDNVAWPAPNSPAGDSVAALGGARTTPSQLRSLGLAAGLLAVVLAIGEGFLRRRRRRRSGHFDLTESEGPPATSAPAGNGAGQPAELSQQIPETTRARGRDRNREAPLAAEARRARAQRSFLARSQHRRGALGRRERPCARNQPAGRGRSVRRVAAAAGRPDLPAGCLALPRAAAGGSGQGELACRHRERDGF